MTGPEVREILCMLTEPRGMAVRLAEKINQIERKIREQCPHEERRPYRACGVETSQCIYCGHEIHVRDY